MDHTAEGSESMDSEKGSGASLSAENQPFNLRILRLILYFNLMDTNPSVILVDENDQEKGIMNKLEAHQKGLLHRAFSVLIYNEKGEMLIQKRATSKYHSPGLWSNTCCSHPSPGETIEQAAKRRLQEEMGLSASLKISGHILYNVDFPNGLTEHEYDHILTGISNSIPKPDSSEVEDFKWVSIPELKKEIVSRPDNFTYWFKLLSSNNFF